jgi:hypothetical protein
MHRQLSSIRRSGICTSIILILIGNTLAGCDIRPVAVGQWQVQIEDASGSRQLSWRIDEDLQIEMQGAGQTLRSQIDTAGSRFSWTLPAEHSADGNAINFGGTVNGNRFSGTLYAQSGNATVTGIRQ